MATWTCRLTRTLVGGAWARRCVGRRSSNATGRSIVTRYKTFNVADCSVCGGVLKPAVVFFGGSIEKDVVQHALTLVDECDAVLAVGTTMMVR